MEHDYEIICGLTGDVAEADDADGALRAAAQLADDAFDALSIQGRYKAARRSLIVSRRGVYDGRLTALAVSGARAVPEALYRVAYLQAVEPEFLPTPPEGVEVDVVEGHRDEMGFPRVDVTARTREAVLAYVREAWGDDDAEWFADYVEARVERVERVAS